MAKQNLDDVLKELDNQDKYKKEQQETNEKFANYVKEATRILDEKDKAKQVEKELADQKRNALIDKIRKFLRTPIRKADMYPFDVRCSARLIDIDSNGTAKLIINGDEVEMAASKVFSEFKPIVEKSDNTDKPKPKKTEVKT